MPDRILFERQFSQRVGWKFADECAAPVHRGIFVRAVVLCLKFCNVFHSPFTTKLVPGTLSSRRAFAKPDTWPSVIQEFDSGFLEYGDNAPQRIGARADRAIEAFHTLHCAERNPRLF